MKTVILIGPEQRRTAKKYVDEAPDGYFVSIREPTRNLEQNALLHAELQEVADSVLWAGKKRDVETWKRLFTSAWLRARGEPVDILPALDGHGVDIVYYPTHKMTKAQMAELITYIQAWKANEHPN